MTKLDEIAVYIELILISLIEVLALFILAENILRALDDPEWYRYIPYMLAGLSLLLVFWAQSILHVVSFIRWPIRIEQMFMYFVAGLVQIVAFSNILSIPDWFFWWAVFSLITVAMYVFDLWIMRDTHYFLEKKKGGPEFLEKVNERHLYELKYLIPYALAFNIFIWLIAIVWTDFFQPVWLYLIPGTIQLAISAYVLYDVTIYFRERSEMLAEFYAEQIPAPGSHVPSTAPSDPLLKHPRKIARLDDTSIA